VALGRRILGKPADAADARRDAAALLSGRTPPGADGGGGGHRPAHAGGAARLGVRFAHADGR
jgi:hypothetical protein